MFQNFTGAIDPHGAHRPFNLALHEHMMALGYSWTHQPATWEESGDAENGPCLDGCPAYDEYTGIDEYVYSGEYGVLASCAIDLEWEAFCREQDPRAAEQAHGC